MINADAMLHLIEFDGRDRVYKCMLNDQDQQLTDLLCGSDELLILDGLVYFFSGLSHKVFEPEIEVAKDTPAIKVSNLRLLLPGIKINLAEEPRLTDFHRQFKAKIDSL